MNLLSLVWHNVTRNKVRSLLTAIGTMTLVFVVTLVWSVLAFLDAATSEKSANVKAIVTERWRMPSQLPYAYVSTLAEGAAREEGDIKPVDYMTWTFYGGSIEEDPAKRSIDNLLFAFALPPEKLLTMMEELDSLTGQTRTDFEAVVEKLKTNRQGIILGQTRLESLSQAAGGTLRVGDRIKVFSMNYKDIDLEFEIVGLFPPGRYDPSAAMNVDYFRAAIDAFEQETGAPHPMADKSLNLVWLKVPSTAAFTQLDEQISSAPYYANPAVKVETASSAVGAFLEAYRDILRGARWLLAPAILLTLSLVIANAISISVREREQEFAVMKVLGFRPRHILQIVLSEAMLIGILAGMASAGGTYLLINKVFDGLKLPIAFFGAFYIPLAAFWWGPAVGAGTAFAGSFFPAWRARRVKVAEIFARVG